MGRPKQSNSRRSRAERKRLQRLLEERVSPADYILARRELFSFVTPTKGPDGRVGEIDQDICDPIGRLHAVGLLDNAAHDSADLRDKGRFWGGHYAKLMKTVGPKMGSYERADKSTPRTALTGDDLLFDRMDANLEAFERDVLFDLIVAPLISHDEGCAWAESLIAEKLIERRKVPHVPVTHGDTERGYLEAAVRGLIQIVDATSRKTAA